MRLVAPVMGAAILVSCARGPTAGTAADGREKAAPLRVPGSERAFRDEPWSFNGEAGRIVCTPHYRVHTTQTDVALLGRLPVFMEAAFEHYGTVAGRGGPGSETWGTQPPPLPAPMPVYVFRWRDHWERMTRQLLGDAAAPFLKIRRGGYAWAGTAVLLDLGSADTLTIAAHEGWHQFTQRTFREALPPWLEEGLATLCEGYEWGAGGLVFRPESNAERRAQLARVVRAGRLVAIDRLATGDGGGTGGPAELDPNGGDEPALDYYAQVWAAALFLQRGQDGRFAPALRACLDDAASGRLAARMVEILGHERASALAERSRGLAVLEAYFARGGVAELDAAYRVFVGGLVR